MIKYVKDIQENGECKQVGVGTDVEYYQSIGMVEKDVEQSEIDSKWYLSSKCPHYTEEEKEQQKQQKESEEKELTLQTAIEELGKEMAKADLAGDEEWKADLRAEYEALIMESEG